MTLVPSPKDFASLGPMSMQQHPHYAATIEALGGRAQAYLCKDGDTPLARVQVIERKIGPVNVAWVPRGPAWPQVISDNDKILVLQKLNRSLPPRSVRLMTPNAAADQALLQDMHFKDVVAGQSFAILDLTRSTEDRLARQHGKWRNRLRQAQNARIMVQSRLFHPDHDRMLLKLENLQRRKKGYRALPPAFSQAWASSNRNAAQVFTAEDQTGLIAFVLVLIHPPGATYHIGWTSDRGRLTSCHNLLLWRASNWLAERGVTELDLGLIDAEAAPGLTRFKLGMGAQTHTTGPTMVGVPKLRIPKLWSRAA